MRFASVLLVALLLSAVLLGIELMDDRAGESSNPLPSPESSADLEPALAPLSATASRKRTGEPLGGELGPRIDAAPDWIEQVDGAEDLLFGALSEFRVDDVVTYPTRENFEALLLGIHGARSFSIKELTSLLPPDHPFWTRYPEQLTRILEAGAESSTVGQALDIREAPVMDWERGRWAHAQGMQWFRLTRVLAGISETTDFPLAADLFSTGVATDVATHLDSASPGTGAAWLSGLDEFQQAMLEERAARESGRPFDGWVEERRRNSTAFQALCKILSPHSDKAGREMLEILYGRGSHMYFLFEVYQLDWRSDSPDFDSMDPYWIRSE